MAIGIWTIGYSLNKDPDLRLTSWGGQLSAAKWKYALCDALATILAAEACYRRPNRALSLSTFDDDLFPVRRKQLKLKLVSYSYIVYKF